MLKRHKSTNGITLVALVITIIILLILAGITIAQLTGDVGIFNKSKNISEKHKEEEISEEFKIKVYELQMEKLGKINSVYQLYEIEKVSTISQLKENIYEIQYNEYVITVDSSFQVLDVERSQINTNGERPTIMAESLYSAIKKINENGIFKVQVEDEIYNLHMYVYYSDVNFNGENTINGAALIDGTYIFGDENDISKSQDEQATNTIVIKVNGNINIENGTIIQPISGDFGGPKGIIVYTEHKLSINNGTIKNTTGCNADSQNVYLYKNNDNSYEMISKNLVLGGIGETISKAKGRGSIFLTNPQVGSDGAGRQTGGGGAGYAGLGNNSNNAGNLNATSGNGSAGTSWSGGAGGGGAAIARKWK